MKNSKKHASLPARFDRRSFLAGLGLSPAFLPFLEPNFAHAASIPKRFAAVVWPNGVLAESFFPDSTGTGFKLKDVTSPLEPHHDDIIILDDIENRAMMDEFPGYGGHASLGYMLTGGNGKLFFNGENSAIGSSISLDQHIGNTQAMRAPTNMHSLVMGIDTREESKADQRYISFRGPAIGNQPNVPTVKDDVHAVFKELYGSGGGMTPSLIDKTLLERKSLLDYVGKDLERFGTNMGTVSKSKVDQHLSSLRELERSLSKLPTMTGGFTPVADDASIMVNRKDDYDKIARAQIELTVGAFATGMTRVSTMLWSTGHNNSWVFKWLGGEYAERGTGDFNVLRNHHEMAHRGGGNADDTRRKNRVDKYFVELFAKLIERFKQVREGDGSMLDNSVLLFANNMGHGGSHSNTRLPWVLAGRAGGYFKTGRYIKQGSGKPHNGVLVAISNAMDVPVQTFGPSKYGGELPNIRGL